MALALFFLSNRAARNFFLSNKKFKSAALRAWILRNPNKKARLRMTNGIPKKNSPFGEFLVVLQ